MKRLLRYIKKRYNAYLDQRAIRNFYRIWNEITFRDMAKK